MGPLLSLSAAGTIGKTLTYKTWKGIQTCTIKSNPSNPQTLTQMLGRAFFAAGGKITKKAKLDGVVVEFVRGIAPAGQSWASYFIGDVMGAQNMNINAAKDAYDLVGNAAQKAIFDDAAEQAGIESVDLDGTENTQVSAGLILAAAYMASNRLGDTLAEDSFETVSESEAFAYTAGLTGVTPA